MLGDEAMLELIRIIYSIEDFEAPANVKLSFESERERVLMIRKETSWKIGNDHFSGSSKVLLYAGYTTDSISCFQFFYPGLSVGPGFQQSLDPDPIFLNIEWDPDQFLLWIGSGYIKESSPETVRLKPDW